MKLKYSLLCSVAALSLSAQVAQAAMVHVAGATVDFYYDTNDIDPLFGSIYVSGDTIFALPTNFSATDTTSDLNSVVTNAMGTIRVATQDGYSFSGVTVGERGVYNISEGTTGSVDVDASLHLFEWDAPLLGASDSLTMTTSVFDQKDGEDHEWSASGAFDMTTATWDGIHNIGLQLSNRLTATAADGGTAYIDKSLVGAVGFTFETVVPVPAAVWLFGSGLIALVGFARRQK